MLQLCAMCNWAPTGSHVLQILGMRRTTIDHQPVTCQSLSNFSFLFCCFSASWKGQRKRHRRRKKNTARTRLGSCRAQQLLQQPVEGFPELLKLAVALEPLLRRIPPQPPPTQQLGGSELTGEKNVQLSEPAETQETGRFEPPIILTLNMSAGIAAQLAPAPASLPSPSGRCSVAASAGPTASADVQSVRAPRARPAEASPGPAACPGASPGHSSPRTFSARLLPWHLSKGRTSMQPCLHQLVHHVLLVDAQSSTCQRCLRPDTHQKPKYKLGEICRALVTWSPGHLVTWCRRCRRCRCLVPRLAQPGGPTW